MQQIPWDQLVRQAENAGGGDPVPANDYAITIASAEAKSSSTGKPMIKLKAKIVGGPHDGRVLWTQLTLSVDNDNAVAIFFRQMAALGLGKEYFAQQPSFENVAQALVGRSAIFEVGIKTWQNQPRNEVSNIKPAGAVPGIAPQAPVAPAPPATPVPPVPAAPVAEAPAVPVPPTPATETSPTPAPPAPPF